MSSKFSLLLLLGLAFVVAGKLQLPKVKNIQTLKQTSEVLSAQNPRNSVGCFDYYRPTLDIITQQYEVQYTNCLLQYSFESDLEDDKWKSSRQQLEKSGSTSCNVLKDCSTIVGYVEAFECFAEAVRSIDGDHLHFLSISLRFSLVLLRALSNPRLCTKFLQMQPNWQSKLRNSTRRWTPKSPFASTMPSAIMSRILPLPMRALTIVSVENRLYQSNQLLRL